MSQMAFLKPVPAERSWWVDLPRDVLTQYAWAERTRMNQGRCASAVSPLERGWTDKRRARPDDSLFTTERRIVSQAERA